MIHNLLEFICALVGFTVGATLFWLAHTMEFTGWQLWFVLISATTTVIVMGGAMFNYLRRSL